MNSAFDRSTESISETMYVYSIYKMPMHRHSMAVVSPFTTWLDVRSHFFTPYIVLSLIRSYAPVFAPPPPPAQSPW